MRRLSGDTKRVKKLADDMIKVYKAPISIVGKIDIQEFGDYRMGLSKDEITKYLQLRSGKKNIKRLRLKFSKAAGCNTMAIGPQGQSLMYRWDVERFADVVLLSKKTYFD